MKALAWKLGAWVAALWWGSLCALGFWVVPLLFASLPSAYLAGRTAAVLFAAQTWVALGCGLYLLVLERMDARASRSRALLWISAGMLLALLSEYAVAPHIQARENLLFWHTLGTVLYAVQIVCAAGVLSLWLRRDAAAR